MAVLTLTLGLSATTTLFSVADAFLLRPLFYNSPERIVDFTVQVNGRPANGVYSPAACRLLQAHPDAFAGVEAYRSSNVVMTGGVEPIEVSILETSPGLLPLLGIAPQIGRWFDDADARGSHGPVAVISDRLWRDELGGNPAIVGTTVTFNDTPHTVVGVMPREFVFPRVAFRAWTLLPASLPERPGLNLVGRLDDGVSFDRAASVVQAMRPEIRQVKGTTQDRDAAIVPPRNITAAQRTPIYILLAAVALVLAMACANVASMTLAVGELRHHELAICAALGSSRARLTRQLVLESTIVAGVAGIAGVWMASLGITGLTEILPRELAFFNANEIAFAPVGAGYFDLLGIPLVAGRVVDQRDTVDNVVIGEPFARRYWGGPPQAIGRQFRVGPNDPWQTVVGVVGDVKQMGPDDRLGDLEYYRSWDAARTSWSVAVRIADVPQRLIPQLKDRIWTIDPTLAIRDSDDMRDRFAASVARPRFFLVVMAVFAAIATGIAGLGIYGLFSYLVTRRTTEIGIRLAVGATPRQVAALVVRDGIALAALGAGLGLSGAWAVSRVLASLLFQTSRSILWCWRLERQPW